MILDIMYGRIIRIVLIAIGFLFLTRKKIIIKQQYFMIFLCTVVFVGKAIDPFGGMFINPYGFGRSAINPIWTDNYLLIIAALYLFILSNNFIYHNERQI